MLACGGWLFIGPHAFEAVQARGNSPQNWYAVEFGLFSALPRVVAEEPFWDQPHSIATHGWHVIDAETTAVERYTDSIQAYTPVEYFRPERNSRHLRRPGRLTRMQSLSVRLPCPRSHASPRECAVSSGCVGRSRANPVTWCREKLEDRVNQLYQISRVSQWVIRMKLWPQLATGIDLGKIATSNESKIDESEAVFIQSVSGRS